MSATALAVISAIAIRRSHHGQGSVATAMIAAPWTIARKNPSRREGFNSRSMESIRFIQSIMIFPVHDYSTPACRMCSPAWDRNGAELSAIRDLL